MTIITDLHGNPIGEACPHTVTIGLEGEKGSWCEACGVKVFEVHDRPCRECRHCNLDLRVCSRLLMAVSPDMHVTYGIGWTPEKGGLCFEERSA